jgi:hypothetical protein
MARHTLTAPAPHCPERHTLPPPTQPAVLQGIVPAVPATRCIAPPCTRALPTLHPHSLLYRILDFLPYALLYLLANPAEDRVYKRVRIHLNSRCGTKETHVHFVLPESPLRLLGRSRRGKLFRCAPSSPVTTDAHLLLFPRLLLGRWPSSS